MCEIDWMQRLRADAGLTQQEMASRLQTFTGEPWNRSKVSRYEREPDKAPWGEILVMRQVLGAEKPSTLHGVTDYEGHGVDAGAPFTALHRDLAAVRDYVETMNWKSPGPGVKVPTTAGLTLLCDKLARKPQIAFFGKFDVGKSTLVNAILGTNSMPTSYQPTTRVITYVRHLADRPEWLSEDVLMLRSGFDPKKWTSEPHCMKHKVVAGGMDTLVSHGTHRGEHGRLSEATYALVFVDSPVLKSCSIIDLPGTENDPTDTKKATAQQIAYDVAVFADTVTGFLGEGSVLRLGEVVRGLPTMKASNSSIRPLSNLFVVATHARRDITDRQIREEILPGGQFRAWRKLGATALAYRDRITGVVTSEQDFRDRFFAFSKELPDRREPLLTDLERLLKVDLPRMLRLTADRDIELFKQKFSEELDSTIECRKATIDAQLAKGQELVVLFAAESGRFKGCKFAREGVEAAIARHRLEARVAFRRAFRNKTKAEKIERLIRTNFTLKEDAQQNAGALVLGQIQSYVGNEASRRTKDVSALIDQLIEKYDQASKAGSEKRLSVGIPFNTKRAFARVLAGLADIGGPAWLGETPGNRGASIVATNSPAVAIAAGGTAAWIVVASTIGGPVTIPLGAVGIAGLLGWKLLRGSWERQLAETISTAFREPQIASSYIDNMAQYWDHAADEFAAGADKAEQMWQKRIQHLHRSIEETDFANLHEELTRLKELRRVFLGLPWGPASNSLS